MRDHATLGVSPDASPEQIKSAYRSLVQRWHPDREGGDFETFHKIQKAYKRLTKRPCSECGGKGKVKIKEGNFSKTVSCPSCWQKETE